MIAGSIGKHKLPKTGSFCQKGGMSSLVEIYCEYHRNLNGQIKGMQVF